MMEMERWTGLLPPGGTLLWPNLEVVTREARWAW
jgi:hypothetical protein